MSTLGTKHFYDTIKLPGGLFPDVLTTSQFNGIEAKLEAFEDYKVTDKRHIAYMLATVYHETAKTMQPVREYGKGANYDYGKRLKRGGGKGKRIPYTDTDQIFYGRGDVQITWYENYAYFGKVLGIDLLHNADLALVPKYSAAIMIKGMQNGSFTGHNLNEYFDKDTTDPFNARKIINGLDAAQKIKEHYEIFYHALQG